LLLKAGQPLIAPMVSNFSYTARFSRYSLSNPCISTHALRGMAGAKVFLRRPRNGQQRKIKKRNKILNMKLHIENNLSPARNNRE
jgi:hypothetical protein